MSLFCSKQSYNAHPTQSKSQNPSSILQALHGLAVPLITSQLISAPAILASSL